MRSAALGARCPNEIVNEIRQAVQRWRQQDYPHITSTTRDLLDHWRDEDRERRLFFCQIEAAETASYLTEAAERIGDTKAPNVIRQENATHNGGCRTSRSRWPRAQARPS